MVMINKAGRRLVDDFFGPKPEMVAGGGVQKSDAALGIHTKDPLGGHIENPAELPRDDEPQLADSIPRPPHL